MGERGVPGVKFNCGEDGPILDEMGNQSGFWSRRDAKSFARLLMSFAWLDAFLKLCTFQEPTKPLNANSGWLSLIRDSLLSCAGFSQVNTQYEEFSPKFETRDVRSLVDRRISPQPFDDMIAGQARHNLSRIHGYRTYGMHDKAGI